METSVHLCPEKNPPPVEKPREALSRTHTHGDFAHSIKRHNSQYMYDDMGAAEPRSPLAIIALKIHTCTAVLAQWHARHQTEPYDLIGSGHAETGRESLGLRIAHGD